VVVWKLDRLGSNMRGIINTLHELTEQGVTVRSLHNGVDTSTSIGRMVAGILMSIAEYERELVRERTALKLEYARKSGRKFGRPAKLTADQAALARRMKGQWGDRRANHPLPLFGRQRRRSHSVFRLVLNGSGFELPGSFARQCREKCRNGG